MILNFFSLLILVVHTLPLKNPSDATLASLSTLIYPRWRPRWMPIISENIVRYGKKCLKLIFFLKLLAVKLESDWKHLACNEKKRNADKIAAVMAVYYKKYEKIFPDTGKL